MPKVEITFIVELVENAQSSSAHVVPITEPLVLDKLLELGFKSGRNPGSWQCGDRIRIIGQEDSPQLVSALELIASRGFRPSVNRIAKSTETQYTFCPRKVRTYAAQEIKSADFLTPHPFHIFPRIGSWAGCVEGRWRVAVDEFQEEQAELGQLDAGTGLITTREFVASLHEANILEAKWDELLYDEPDKVIKPLGMLSSSVVMPSCLLQRQNEDGYPWKDEDAKVARTAGCYWNDDGYQPEELRFDRAAVEALGPFDIAVTKEQTGMHPGLYCHTLVVSQRFREFVEKRKVPGAQWVPVRLV